MDYSIILDKNGLTVAVAPGVDATLWRVMRRAASPTTCDVVVQVRVRATWHPVARATCLQGGAVLAAGVATPAALALLRAAGHDVAAAVAAGLACLAAAPIGGVVDGRAA